MKTLALISDMKFFSIKIWSLALLFSSCSYVGSQTWKLDKQAEVPHDFSEPINRWELDKSLHEISGLEFDASARRLLSINDEKGIIYQIDKENGASSALYEFHKGGDYEGIAIAGKFIFVLKSNGKLYQYNSQSGKTKKLETGLSEHNDAEALYHDSHTNSLLIACKGLPLSEKKHQKAVCRFSLETNQLSAEPVLQIDLKALKAQAQAEKLSGEQLWRIKRFAPSGLAVHPQTGAYYILSARGSMLMIVSAQQQIESIIFLDVKTLPQPEGITFDEEHHLYIASEGKAGKGKLVKYRVKQ